MDEKHKIAKERFEEACQAHQHQRDMMREALAFSNPADPQQWDSKIARERQLAKRPSMVYDRTNQYICNTVNQYRQSKLSIETMPVDDNSDSHTSQVIDGILRHIEHRCRAWIARETAVDHMVRAGAGYTVVLPEQVGDQVELSIKRVLDPTSVLIDPDCTEPDGLGAGFGVWCESVGVKKFKATWGEKTAPADWNIDNGALWRDHDSIIIANYFELIERKETILKFQHEGREYSFTEAQYMELAQELGYPPGPVMVESRPVKRVRWSKMTGYETLEETEIMCGHIPIVPYVGDELLVDGRLYRSGLVKKLMSSQISYNMTRNLEVEFMSKQPKAPMMVPAAAVSQYTDEWAKLNSGSPAYLLYEHLDEQGNPIPAPQQLNPAPLPAGYQYLGNKELAD
ncbi:MAG: portal protein, partial [Aeromonas sp.]